MLCDTPGCGNQVPPRPPSSGGGPNRRYCSDRCRRKYQNSLYNKRRKEACDERKKRWKEGNREKFDRYMSSWRADRRAAELEACGNPSDCGICSKVLVGTDAAGRDPRCIDHRHDNGVIRGVVCARCNHLLAAFDLRYTDPAFWAKLLAWSSIGEPPVEPEVKHGGRRRILRHPTLFGGS